MSCWSAELKNDSGRGNKRRDLRCRDQYAPVNSAVCSQRNTGLGFLSDWKLLSPRRAQSFETKLRFSILKNCETLGVAAARVQPRRETVPSAHWSHATNTAYFPDLCFTRNQYMLGYLGAISCRIQIICGRTSRTKLDIVRLSTSKPPDGLDTHL